MKGQQGKGERDASVRDVASAQTLQIPRPSRALLSNTGPAHIKPAQMACARLDCMEEITNSSQEVTWASVPLDVPTQECFWKVSPYCLRQQPSYADKTLPPARRTSHLHERALLTRLLQQSLCSALHKITAHRSPRERLRALHAIKNKTSLVK